MKFPFHITLPLTDPVLIFSLVLFIILLAPLILRKFRIPGIVGLILAGVVIGPHGFNLLLRDSSIVLFGTVGLLYIMFLAGLDLDQRELKKNKNKSILFGALTFLVPFLIGFFTCYELLGYKLVSSILVASMFSTHTLVAYPIASRLGILRNEAVTVAVGGTIITDSLVLLIFAFITGSERGGLDSNFWIHISISIAIFIFLVFWVFPRIGRWFFKNIEGEKTSQYIFVLAMVFLAGFFAQVAGIDPIIGAFMAGLALNRMIPKTSPLMNRIEFVGNALFIPFFLIGVGMLVDLRVLFRGTEALEIAAILTIAAIFGKWIAAFVVQKVSGYSADQRNVIFGLSTSHAAATLAIILTGFNLGIVDENILNGTIVLILITCLVASFVTERAGRRLAIKESEKIPEQADAPEKILIPITDPAAIERLLDLAIMMKDPHSANPVYPLAIVQDDDEAREKVVMSQRLLEKAAIHASATDSPVQVLTRVDLNFASGIIRTIKEVSVTDVVLNWDENVKPSDRLFGTSWIFGSTLDNLLQSSWQMIMLCKLIQPINTFKRIVVVVPPNGEFETGCRLWLKRIQLLARQVGMPIVFYCSYRSSETLKKLTRKNRSTGEDEYKFFKQWDEFQILSHETGINDLLVVIGARRGTVSYYSSMDTVPSKLSRYFHAHSFILVYPEQSPSGKTFVPSEDIAVSPIQENIERLSKFGRMIRNIFRGGSE